MNLIVGSVIYSRASIETIFFSIAKEEGKSYKLGEIIDGIDYLHLNAIVCRQSQGQEFSNGTRRNVHSVGATIQSQRDDRRCVGGSHGGRRGFFAIVFDPYWFSASERTGTTTYHRVHEFRLAFVRIVGFVLVVGGPSTVFEYHRLELDNFTRVPWRIPPWPRPSGFTTRVSLYLTYVQASDRFRSLLLGLRPYHLSRVMPLHYPSSRTRFQWFFPKNMVISLSTNGRSIQSSRDVRMNFHQARWQSSQKNLSGDDHACKIRTRLTTLLHWFVDKSSASERTPSVATLTRTLVFSLHLFLPPSCRFVVSFNPLFSVRPTARQLPGTTFRTRMPTPLRTTLGVFCNYVNWSMSGFFIDSFWILHVGVNGLSRVVACLCK